MSVKRKEAHRFGLWAEEFAALYLGFKGYKILHRRYKTRGGEIDLLLEKGNVLVAVEVKFRRGREFGDVLETVHHKNRRRVEDAVRYFLSQNPSYSGHDIRFDVMAVRWPFGFVHLDNAWQAHT